MTDDRIVTLERDLAIANAEIEGLREQLRFRISEPTATMLLDGIHSRACDVVDEGLPRR